MSVSFEPNITKTKSSIKLNYSKCFISIRFSGLTRIFSGSFDVCLFSPNLLVFFSHWNLTAFSALKHSKKTCLKGVSNVLRFLGCWRYFYDRFTITGPLNVFPIFPISISLLSPLKHIQNCSFASLFNKVVC